MTHWVSAVSQPTPNRRCECPYCGTEIKFHYEKVSDHQLKAIVDSEVCMYFIDIDPDADEVGFGPDPDLKSKAAHVRVLLYDVLDRIKAGKVDILTESKLREAIKMLGG